MKKYLFYISQLYSFAIVRPLQTAIIARGDEVAWFFDDPEKLLPYLRPNETCLRTTAEVKEYDPCAVFAPGNVVPDFFPGIKVALFHGFNAKKRSNERGHFRIRNFFDLYCTQGPDTTLPFQELEKTHGFFEVTETGWPKMDPLFEDNTIASTETSRHVVLLTSTFTTSLSGAPHLFETVKAMAATGRWQWLVNFHPKMSREVVQSYQAIQSEYLEYVETDNIIPLLKTADVMVSDTSSVISEFLLQTKPVITYKNRAAGPHLIDISEATKLEESIDYALTHPEKLMKSIDDYTKNIHPYRDGRSSIRVLEATDRLVAKGLDHLKRKPTNLVRSLKLRRQLKYYKL